MSRLKQWDKLPFHWLLPLAFFFLGLQYLYSSPHFESPDSIFHVGVIKWISEHDGALPVQSADHDELYAHEGSQPPLYYLLMAPIWSAIDTTDFDDFYQINPLVIAGHPSRLGNRNQVFYRQPHPPFLHGTSLAIYIIRILTLGMSTVTVFAIYQASRTAIPANPGFAVLATALTAFNPQFLFVSTSVSNDNLVTMLAALTTWQVLLMLRDGFEMRRNLTLGILVPLAILAKLSGLALVLLVAASAIWLAIRTRNYAGVARLGVIMLALGLTISGWWFVRNLTLYQELFGTEVLIDNFGGRHTTVPRLLVEEFEGFRRSYWGLFGWFSNFTNEAHYLAMDILSAVGIAGLSVYLYKNRRNTQAIFVCSLLSMLVIFGAVMLIWYTLQTTASQGRLLFPHVAAISLLLAMGLTALRIPALLIAIPMFAFALAAPFAYILPQYDHPPKVKALPASATSTLVSWDDITLVGQVLPPARRWSPGDEIPITLYWRPLKATVELHALFISLIDTDGNALATIDAFPGWGSLPTTWWEQNTIYQDDYILQIPEDAAGFSAVWLHIGWYPFPGGSNIHPVLESGKQTEAYTFPIGAFAPGDVQETLGSDSIAEGNVFGDAIRLNAYRFSQGNLLELEWQLLREQSGDLRVFAIVLAEPYQEGAPFEVLLQADAVPAVPVPYLRPDETILTRHVFDLPAGYQRQHGVYFGWYNEAIEQRLTVAHPANMLESPGFNFYRPVE